MALPGTLPGRRTVRVLALEDDADTREVFTLFLDPDEGFTLELCDTVDGCLACLRAALTAPFDVLLMDILLSQGHTGLEVLDAARADATLVVPPIVVCTALNPSALDGYAAALAGFETRIVFKPFNLDDLQAAILAAAGLG